MIYEWVCWEYTRISSIEKKIDFLSLLVESILQKYCVTYCLLLRKKYIFVSLP